MVILKSCFFIGHREADERLLPTLVNAIERLVVSEDVTCFYVGGYGGFDRITATAVKQVKVMHFNPSSESSVFRDKESQLL